MSSGDKKPLADALTIATSLRRELLTACERIEIAGSVRRRSGMVGDIEIVAIPRFADISNRLPIDRMETPGVDLLYNRLVALVGVKVLLPIRGFKPGAKSMQFATKHGLKVDLFICTPETWGVNFTVRTGSADFSHGLFTHANRLGITSSGARLVRKDTGEVIDTPDERDVFRVLGLEWVEPSDRIDSFRLKRIKP